MDCPVQWPLATPLALESQSRANQGSVVANPICKCTRHKAGHLQVRVAVGKRSTCVLKEAPLNKGPLGFLNSLRDLGIGNGVGKEGRGNQPPYRRYGPDTEIQLYRPPGSHTDWQKQAEFSPKAKPIRNFSIDPTSSIRTPIADAIFADAISESHSESVFPEIGWSPGF